MIVNAGLVKGKLNENAEYNRQQENQHANRLTCMPAVRLHPSVYPLEEYCRDHHDRRDLREAHKAETNALILPVALQKDLRRSQQRQKLLAQRGLRCTSSTIPITSAAAASHRNTGCCQFSSMLSTAKGNTCKASSST